MLYHVKIELHKVQEYIFRYSSLKAVLGANASLGVLFRKTLPEIFERNQGLIKPYMDFAQTLPLPSQEFSFDNPAVNFTLGIVASAGGHFEGVLSDRECLASFTEQVHRILDTDFRGIRYSLTWRELDSRSTFDEFSSSLAYDCSIPTHEYEFPADPFRKPAVEEERKLEAIAGDFYRGRTSDFLNPVLSAIFESCPEWSVGRKGIMTLNDLAVASRRVDNNRIALIHIDGNDMGKRFRVLRDLVADKPVLEAFAMIENFWHSNREKFRMRLLDACAALYKDSGSEYREFPFIFFMLGGDDLIFATVPELVFPFIKAFCVQDPSKSAEGETTFGTGVAIVKSSFPILHAMDLAEELLKSAKVKSKSFNPSVNAVDWHVLYDSTLRNIEQVRRRDYMILGKGFVDIWTERPCTVQVATEIWREAVTKVAGFSGDPSDSPGHGQYKRLYSSLAMGWDKVKAMQDPGEPAPLPADGWIAPLSEIFEGIEYRVSKAMDILEMMELTPHKDSI